jgi:hypothetical protein
MQSLSGGKLFMANTIDVDMYPYQNEWYIFAVRWKIGRNGGTFVCGFGDVFTFSNVISYTESVLTIGFNRAISIHKVKL